MATLTHDSSPFAQNEPPFHPLDWMFVVVMATIAILSLRMVVKTVIYFLYC